MTTSVRRFIGIVSLRQSFWWQNHHNWTDLSEVIRYFILILKIVLDSRFWLNNDISRTIAQNHVILVPFDSSQRDESYGTKITWFWSIDHKISSICRCDCMEVILLLKSIYKYENMCDSDYKHLWLYRRGFNNKKIGNQKPCDCMEYVIIWEVTIGRTTV